MALVSRQQFTEQVIHLIREKFPLVKIARGDLPFSLRVNGSVLSLENLYRMSADDPQTLPRNVNRWMVEWLRAWEGSPDRHATFDELRGRILPMLASSKSRNIDQSPLISQPLIADLSVLYALDEDRSINYVPRGLFESWDIAVEELHEIAIQNLVARSQALAAQVASDEAGQSNLVMFQTLDGYDASRLLLPSLNERLREFLGSPFVAATPHRDVLLCFRDEEEMVASFSEQIQLDYSQMPHQITDTLILVTPDGLAPRL